MGSFADLAKEASPRNSEILAEETLPSRANLWCHKDDCSFQQTTDDFRGHKPINHHKRKLIPLSQENTFLCKTRNCIVHQQPFTQIHILLKLEFPTVISHLEGLYKAYNFGEMEHSLYSNTFQCPFSFGKFHPFKASHQDGPLITSDRGQEY